MIDRLDIHAYADRELSPEEIAKLGDQISGSPEASRELQAIQALKYCLQTKLSTEECNAMWKQCQGRLDELDRAKKAEFYVSKYAWAICSILFLVIVGGGLFNRYRGGIGLSQVASLNSEFLPMATPRVSNPEHLRDWLGDQTGQRTRLFIDPSTVVWAAYSDQPEMGRIVRFRLRDGDGLVDLTIVPNVERVSGAQPIGNGMMAGQINGRNCVVQFGPGVAVFWTGDRDFQQLCDCAQSHTR